MGRVTTGAVDQGDVRVFLFCLLWREHRRRAGAARCQPPSLPPSLQLPLSRAPSPTPWSLKTHAPQIDDLSFTLNEEELGAGLALLCMARPSPASDPAVPIEVETQSDYGYSLGSAEWNGATGRIEGGAPVKLM